MAGDNRKTGNTYAQLLKEQGTYVVTVEGIDWYEYRGFMVPAYLPHCCPEISPEAAEEVVRISDRPFARWDSEFGKVEISEWWYVLKRGPWDVEDIKNKKKRWMIRQGRKYFSVRSLTFDEVVAECPKVAQLAAERYTGKAKVETRQILEERISSAKKIPGVLEYIGCFRGNTLVSFSENYIQSNAVWLANIRHHPAFLKKYSSYGLMDGILDYYLNQKKMYYVSDGTRSIHHRTHFQEHLINVFGFTKEYALLNIIYSKKFGTAVKLAYPFRNIVWALSNKLTTADSLLRSKTAEVLDKISAVLRHERIRKSCKK